MTFSLSQNSENHLAGVHPRMVQVVRRAIQLTTVDFSVNEGLRSLERQRHLLAIHATKTLDSKHRKQPDGFGHAVDLVPFVDGSVRWEWGPIWFVACAVDKAATELGVRLTWGAVWDRTMMDYGGSPEALKAAVEDYKKRHKGSDFLDGPHYQLA